MKLTPITSSTPSAVAAVLYEDACSHLARSEKGSRALRALASICDDLVSLDSENQAALVYLTVGVFNHPGTAREVLKESAK